MCVSPAAVAIIVSGDRHCMFLYVIGVNVPIHASSVARVSFGADIGSGIGAGVGVHVDNPGLSFSLLSLPLALPPWQTLL